MKTFLKYAKILGPVYDIFVFGDRLTVLCDVGDIQEVLRSRPKTFRRPRRDIKTIFNDADIPSDSLFSSESDEWSRQRRIVAPAFNKKTVENFLEDIWLEAESQSMLIPADAKTAVNFLKIATTFTIRIIAKVAFGFQGNSDHQSNFFYSSEFQADLKHITTYITQKVLFGSNETIWRLSPKFKYQRLATEAGRRITAVAQEIMTRERVRQPCSSSFMQSLLRAKGEAHLSDSQVISNVISIFIAGTDTTAVAISYMLYFLSQHPAALAEAREEADRVLAPSFLQNHSKTEAVAALRMGWSCFMEAMRLACPVAAINLQLTDSAGPEVRLKSGTLIRNTDTVWAALEVLREDSTFFPDPLAFKPHRWLDATPSQVLQMENLILPFGFGPRICPGMSLALIEGPVVVAHILHHFDFRLDCPPTEVVRVASLTVGPSKMPIVFTPR